MYRVPLDGYTVGMVQRTTVELDPERLAEVRKLLGTTGIKDTIEAAFDRIVRQARREDLLEILTNGESLDLGPEMFAQARPRTP